MSGPVVGDEAGVRPPLPYDSNATGDAEADASIAARRSLPFFGTVSNRRASTVSVRVSATDPSRTPSGKNQPASRVHLPVGLRRENRFYRKPMTTPVTVSQVTSSRSQNIPAAAGHRRRARRSPGRSPGTTDFASRPGFTHDLGWGPLQTWRYSRQRTVRVASGALAPRDRCMYTGESRGSPARARNPITNRGRSFAPRQHCRGGRSTFLGVGSPTGGPALGRTRPVTGVSASLVVAVPRRGPQSL